jgi:histidinol-phosphatase (PHP family)
MSWNRAEMDTSKKAQIPHAAIMTYAIADYHVHENHSSDAPNGYIESYIKEAEAKGIREIAFTTHFIIQGQDADFGIQEPQINEYIESIRRADEETNIKLKAGLEVDYFPDAEKELDRILADHTLDYVLGSVHYINGLDIGSRRASPDFFLGREITEATDEYFTEWRKAVESGLFDVMAHPDYWRKFLGLVYDPVVKWVDYGRVVHEAIDSMVSYNVGFEVNTSAHRHGLKTNYPIQKFTKAAYEADVKTVTVGTDSHSPSHLGFKTSQALDELRKAGYRYISLFSDRKKQEVSLEDALNTK